jgi:phospholipid/cholesterol/gamma-HCH transport system substrate-binding protein
VSPIQSSTVKVGALMLAGFGVLGAVIVLAGTKPGLFASSIDLEARFHTVNGLQIGAPVTLFGMNVGTVRQISFSSDPAGDYVVVHMRIDKTAARRLHVDSRAQIETIGMLGDKFVKLTPGTPQTALVRPGAAVNAIDPVDFEALVGQQNSRDFMVNVYFIASSMRVLLDELQNGHGLLRELMRGGENGEQLSLHDLKQTLERIDHVSAAAQKVIGRAADERSFAGAMLSRENNGRKMLSDLAASLASLRVSVARLDRLSYRAEHAQGLIPRLAEDPQLADQLMSDLGQTSRKLQQILDKINTGQGTLGKMVNDPTLYNRANSLLSGGGWGTSLIRGLYGVSHPFSPPPAQSQNDHPATGRGSPKELSISPSSAAIP